MFSFLLPGYLDLPSCSAEGHCSCPISVSGGGEPSGGSLACSPQSLTSSSGFYTHNAYDSCNGHSPPGTASHHVSPDSATSGFSGSLFSGSALSGVSNQRERGGLLSPSSEYLLQLWREAKRNKPSIVKICQLPTTIPFHPLPS